MRLRPVVSSMKSFYLSLLALLLILSTLSCATAPFAPFARASEPSAKATEEPAIPPPPTETSAPSASPTITPTVAAPTATSLPPTSTAVPPSPTPKPPTATPTQAPDLTKVRPNELGEVPILEYHLIGVEDGRWSRSTASFRGDLERLYRLGFRTIKLSDYLDNRIDLPAGTSPVILTFDDSSPGQFRMIVKDGKPVVDPLSAVGVLEQFEKEHPDFGMHAVFYVLPGADKPHNFFGQDEYRQAKIEYIVSHGMEVGNHTFWHQNLGKASDSEVQEQLGRAVFEIQKLVPSAKVETIALPLGEWPKNKKLALSGQWKDTKYNNRAVLLVGAEPAPSPNSVDYDPMALPRIQVIPTEMDNWLSYLTDKPKVARYISDGNPDTLTFPAEKAKSLGKSANLTKIDSPNSGYSVYRLR